MGGVDSETVGYLCEIAKSNPKTLKFGAWRGKDTRGHAVALLNPYRGRLATVRVDADGVGYNFGLHLRDQRFPVELVHVGIPVESRPNQRADDPALRFFNQKAQLYQRVANLLERDGLDGLTDDTTIGQLAGIFYEIDPRGRIMIESKEKARQRGVQSPDRAEALMLALGKPHQPMEWHSVRELRDLKSPFYHGSDDDDYLLRGRRWDVFAGKLRFRNRGAW